MDDMAPVPQAPQPLVQDDVQEEVVSDEDKFTAASYFHPAWGAVEKMFLEEIETLSLPVPEDKEAAEYKITSIANERVKGKLNEILARVKTAVKATEKGKK